MQSLECLLCQSKASTTNEGAAVGKDGIGCAFLLFVGPPQSVEKISVLVKEGT